VSALRADVVVRNDRDGRIADAPCPYASLWPKAAGPVLIANVRNRTFDQAIADRPYLGIQAAAIRQQGLRPERLIVVLYYSNQLASEAEYAIKLRNH
jgi:hypothetical protein